MYSFEITTISASTSLLPRYARTHFSNTSIITIAINLRIGIECDIGVITLTHNSPGKFCNLLQIILSNQMQMVMSLNAHILHEKAKELNDQSDEHEILKRIAEGEKNLYALMIRKYNQRLYRIALSIINNESDVEDLMQTAYIKAYENLDKFKFNSGFSTWLIRILINECLMHLKKRERISNTEAGNFFPDLYQKPIVQTPLMKVINSELKTILEFTIRKLPEKYRTVFIMRELENMTVLETKECLGISEANVKIRLNRAKVILRDKLKSYISEDQPLQFYKPRCNRIVDAVMEKIH